MNRLLTDRPGLVQLLLGLALLVLLLCVSLLRQWQWP